MNVLLIVVSQLSPTILRNSLELWVISLSYAVTLVGGVACRCRNIIAIKNDVRRYV